ncbi:hypothetical protein RRG08_052310 [Elysia crispata]|uniref:Uncharacterized protein n=1 Tax=Elysia crispata TaxID=231223 RepID=A0AAE1DZI9_9GAST|nr:hypothetical protein RRG08_052310 [Elysia crispata]
MIGGAENKQDGAAHLWRRESSKSNTALLVQGMILFRSGGIRRQEIGRVLYLVLVLAETPGTLSLLFIPNSSLLLKWRACQIRQGTIFAEEPFLFGLHGPLLAVSLIICRTITYLAWRNVRAFKWPAARCSSVQCYRTLMRCESSVNDLCL